MRVLTVTNMYPSAAEPAFGCFVKEQVEDLVALGVDADVVQIDGRESSVNYGRAVGEIRRRTGGRYYDLVHAHYGLTGAVAAVQRQTPVITTFHGSETGYVRWQSWVSRVVARTTVPVFVSAENARAVGISSPRVIPCGVDTDLFSPVPREGARRELGWEPTGRYVLFPGGASNRRKRHDLFLAAVEEANRDGLGLQPVTLEGWSRQEAVLVMNAVDVVVMTSDWEGSPMAVREALACSTPVVSVDVGDVRTVLEGLPGCSSVDRSPVALARGIAAALEAGRSPLLRERAQYSSRRAVARRIVRLYEEVARTC
ncbi:MAG: teichuronic acid biosynthesis glycosyltransferase TuaC [Gaiellaceae bacterium]|nr:teichuronic acid biosynthesis glycosyltransferase TuaC [Gaiellaceae bacterium]